jgi:hypothetical protein
VGPNASEVMSNYALLQMGLSWQDLQIIPYDKAHELLVLYSEILLKEKEDSKK